MSNCISRKASCFVFPLVVLMLAASAALAQVAPDNNVEQPAVQGISTVTASAIAERVRFTSPNTVVQLRLEVYDEAGQKLLDTEQRGGNVLDWHLQGGSGERVPDGVYLCVVTSKNLSGRLSQKLGQVIVTGQSTSVRSAAVGELNLRQAQSVGPIEMGEAGLTVMGPEDAPPVTVLANNGAEAQLARTRGALTFQLGDFFSGNDKEQMRLTEDGNLGIGTSKPKTRLDVAGMIRAREGFMFSDGSKLNVNEKGVLTHTSAAGVTPSVVTTQNKIAKFTDNAGGVGDSVITELTGNIGIGNASPTQALDVLNGRIVTTGSQTLNATSDSMIEVKSTITNNGVGQSAIKARNIFNGPGNFVTGSDIAPTFAPSASIGTAQGFVAAAFFAPPSGVTITNALGGASATGYSNVTGAVTNGISFNVVSPFVLGSLKPTNQYGLRINNQGLNGTSISYGLFVDPQSGSTLHNYSAIFAGGLVGMGTTLPLYPLSVVGTTGSGQDQAVAEFSSAGTVADTGVRLKNTAANGRTWTLFSSGGSTGIGAGNFNIYDATLGTSRFTITPLGHVGIGAGMNVDAADLGNGTVDPGITFGNGSGEGISSKRTAGGNQFGLDLFTNFTSRLSINQSGDVNIPGNLSAHNLPGITYSQSDGAGGTHYGNSFDVVLDSITMSVPATGFVLVSASLNTGSINRASEDFKLLQGSTELVRTNSNELNAEHTIFWVIPVSAGPLSLHTALFRGPDGQGNFGGTYFAHALTAVFLPVQY